MYTKLMNNDIYIIYIIHYQVPTKTKAFVIKIKVTFAKSRSRRYEPVPCCCVGGDALLVTAAAAVPVTLLVVPPPTDADMLLLLYGRFELHNTVYTLSILLSFSKNGIKSSNSESVISSNHDATGTCICIIHVSLL